MIHAYAIQHAGVGPRDNASMAVREHPLVLDPQADERVDIEESPIGQILLGHPPVGQAVVLPVQ